jgi:predicted PurR-regulated permease PerM
MMVFVAIGIYLCCRLAAPFLAAVIWAMALTVMFSPLHQWIEKRVNYPNIAAMICVLFASLVILVPAIFIADRMISEATTGSTTFKVMVESGEWRKTLEGHSFLAPIGKWIEHQFDLPEIVNAVTSWLTISAGAFFQGSAVQIVGIVLTFYLLFYFLRDRSMILESIRFLTPFSESDMIRVFEGVNNTVHATIYGTLAVAVVQGTLGGLMFWWLGLSSPLLWGVVMAVLAIVPVLGAFIIWIPAAIFLVLQGNEGKALLLTIWGAIVVGGIDNLLYPMLVGSQLKMHTVLAFISIVGGLIVFGSSGLILGPVIFTVTRLLLEIVWEGQNQIDGTEK